MGSTLERHARLPLIVIAALACLATPASRYERNYPAWVFDDGKDGETRELGFDCARVTTWISKSGKEGVGLSFEIENLIPDHCPVELTYAAFVPGDVTVKPRDLPRPLDLRDEERETIYVPFAFDNEQLWNEGKREGVLYLTVKIRGDVREYHLPLAHKLDGFQKLRYPSHSPAKSPT